MKSKTSELQDAALDWAVAKCEGYFLAWFVGQDQHYWESPEGAKHFLDMRNATGHGVHWTHSSTDWGEGGPIIEREEINIHKLEQTLPDAAAPHPACWGSHIDGAGTQYGPTPLIAGMRCYVASKLGDEIDVPDELI
jgi:hypothetical protein